MIESKHIIMVYALGFMAAAYYLIIGASIYWWIAALFVYFLFSCLGITITFHRHLAHKSFSFKWEWLRKLCIVFGSLSGTGSAIAWVAVHKKHHKFSDSKHDPHGPGHGWKNFFNDYDTIIDYKSVKPMLQDKFLRWMHRHGLKAIVAYYVILFIVGGLPALAFLGFIPQMLVALMSALLNYFAHSSGYRTYDIVDDSRNNWWLAIPTWGESWHNNHHAKPRLWSFKHKWWEVDISGAIIKLIKE